MSAGWNNILGIHPDALNVHSKRAKILANNIANQDTPNFKARDVDFKSILKGISDDSKNVDTLKTSSGNHINKKDITADDLKFRQGLQPSVDGNTVDGQLEQAEYAENSIRYMANLEFLNGKINKIMLAIKGTR